MELCYLKSNALATLKNSLNQTYDNYLTKHDNSWILEVCGEDPFVPFRDIPDFELAPLDAGLNTAEIEFRNSKILYKNLHFMTPRQAADERFWAGFCHGTFYDYVRRRWGYDKIDNLSDLDKDKTVAQIKNKFFFNGKLQEELWSNTLAKYWWAGHLFPSDVLKTVGVGNLFFVMSRSFAGNETLRNGFTKFLRYFSKKGMTLNRDNQVYNAVTELTKVGGAIVLDCLTEDEVAAIMIGYVERNIQIYKKLLQE